MPHCPFPYRNPCRHYKLHLDIFLGGQNGCIIPIPTPTPISTLIPIPIPILIPIPIPIPIPISGPSTHLRLHSIKPNCVIWVMLHWQFGV